MKVRDARLLGVAAVPGGGPRPERPEVAIAGRSNVGKSSLINVLLGRRGLARTSRTPGRTRQLNFFLVNDEFVLVDLPGYGYASGPAAEREAWGPLVETYLRGRPTLRGLVLLVDVRRGIEAEEEQLLDFLAAERTPVAVVVTKVDKLGRDAGARACAAVGRGLPAGTPVVGFSAHTGAGRAELWRVLLPWIAA